MCAPSSPFPSLHGGRADGVKDSIQPWRDACEGRCAQLLGIADVRFPMRYGGVSKMDDVWSSALWVSLDHYRTLPKYTDPA